MLSLYFITWTCFIFVVIFLRLGFTGITTAVVISVFFHVDVSYFCSRFSLFVLSDDVNLVDKHFIDGLSVVLLALLLPGTVYTSQFHSHQQSVNDPDKVDERPIFVPVSWGGNFRQIIMSQITGPRPLGAHCWFETAKGLGKFVDNPFSGDYIVIPYTRVPKQTKNDSPCQYPEIKTGFPFKSFVEGRKEIVSRDEIPGVLTVGDLVGLAQCFGDTCSEFVQTNKSRGESDIVSSELYCSFLKSFHDVPLHEDKAFFHFVEKFPGASKVELEKEKKLGGFEGMFRYAKNLIKDSMVGIEVIDGQHRLYTVASLLHNGGVITEVDRPKKDLLLVSSAESRYRRAKIQRLKIHTPNFESSFLSDSGEKDGFYYFPDSFLKSNKLVGRLLADHIGLYEERPLSTSIHNCLLNLNGIDDLLEDLKGALPELMIIVKTASNHGLSAVESQKKICKKLGDVRFYFFISSAQR